MRRSILLALMAIRVLEHTLHNCGDTDGMSFH